MNLFIEELKDDLRMLLDKLEGFSQDPQYKPSRNELILHIAATELGTKEVQGSGNNAKVMEYHKYATKSNNVEQPDSVPWCASFVCWVLEHVYPDGDINNPMESTNSMMARAYLNWGKSTLSDPLPGDIVVFWRGQRSGWQGHVGFFLRTNSDGSIVTLGGNQSDEVNISMYSSAKLLDIRRSSKARIYTPKDIKRLKNISRALIDGEYINQAGSLA